MGGAGNRAEERTAGDGNVREKGGLTGVAVS